MERKDLDPPYLSKQQLMKGSRKGTTWYIKITHRIHHLSQTQREQASTKRGVPAFIDFDLWCNYTLKTYACLPGKCVHPCTAQHKLHSNRVSPGSRECLSGTRWAKIRTCNICRGVSQASALAFAMTMIEVYKIFGFQLQSPTENNKQRSVIHQHYMHITCTDVCRAT